MLKNNKEREQYFNDPTHWHVLHCNETYATDLIRVVKLDGYPIIAIKATIILDKPHDVVLGYYQMSSDRTLALHDIYSKTYHQCIAIMRDSDNDKAN